MTFLNAWAAGFAGIAPVIVLLYLLKLKRRPMPVSTLLFWQRLLQENRRRAFFQKLRQLFSLLLHLLIFALLLGALAHPTLDRQITEGASTVLVVDTRARMQATEPDGQTRFAKAKAEAMNIVRQASALRQMAMITVDASARVVTPFTDDEKALRENLAQAHRHVMRAATSNPPSPWQGNYSPRAVAQVASSSSPTTRQIAQAR